MDILDWAWDEDVMAVLGLLQLNKLSISWSSSINSLESCGLISEGLLGAIHAVPTVAKQTLTYKTA